MFTIRKFGCTFFVTSLIHLMQAITNIQLIALIFAIANCGQLTSVFTKAPLRAARFQSKLAKGDKCTNIFQL